MLLTLSDKLQVDLRDELIGTRVCTSPNGASQYLLANGSNQKQIV